jgi:drug/metabolite transporter (DMT)-like permease
VTGVLWGAASGLGFGLFQSLNIRAVRQLDNAYLSTFIQLAVAAVVLVVVCASAGDLSRIGEVTPWAVACFGLAGLLHFLLGWTCLNISQKRIGAARTAPLLTTVPLWGIAIAAVTLGELPSAGAAAGVAAMVAGALVVASPGRAAEIRRRDSLFAVATAFLWALSPVFTVRGLDEVDSPLLGVTLGVVISALAYAALLAAWPGTRERARGTPGSAVALKVVGGGLVALATWGRWVALDTATVGVVLGLSLLAVPVVLVLSPFVGGRQAERVDARVLIGAGLVIAGALVIVAVE